MFYAAFLIFFELDTKYEKVEESCLKESSCFGYKK